MSSMTKPELEAQLEEMKARLDAAEKAAAKEAEARKKAEDAAAEALALLDSAESASLLPEKTVAKVEKVELSVPRGAAGDDPNLFIGVNGQNYLLPKGKKSMVPDFIAAEYYRSIAAQEKMEDRAAEMREN